MSAVRLGWSFIFLFVVSFAVAQSGTAEKAWASRRYQDAADLYLLEYKADRTNVIAIARLAECNRQLKNFEEAEGWYDHLFAISPPSPDNALAYAQVLASNKKYELSRLWYRKFGDLRPEDPRADLFDIAYGNMATFFKDSAKWDIFYLAINTEADEYAPMIMDSALYFTSNRIKDAFFKSVSSMNREPYTDIFMVPDRYDLLQVRVIESTDTSDVSRKRNQVTGVYAGSDNRPFYTVNNRFLEKENAVFEAVKEVVRLPKVVNTKLHEGNGTYSRANKMMFYNTTQSATGDTSKVSGAFYDYQKLKLVFQYYRGGGEWGDRQNFQFNSKTYSTAHPSISDDGQFLYFISDMPGGYGGTDIYYCVKTENYWSEPVNMGPSVNTISNEVFPYINGNKLYFSTTGWPGLGGLDVFVIDLNDADRTASGTPRNVGYPINSSSDDFGIVYDRDGINGYFSTNRRGSDDIYKFGRP